MSIRSQVVQRITEIRKILEHAKQASQPGVFGAQPSAGEAFEQAHEEARNLENQLKAALAEVAALRDDIARARAEAAPK